jgi:hypothetical protein
MGSVNDIMQTFAHKDLHARFPDYNGWKWESVPCSENPGMTFCVSRYSNYQYQMAFVSVSLDQKPAPSHVAAIMGLPHNLRTFKGYFLLVPQGADVSGIPEEIEVLFMTSFGFVDGRLIWLTKKKNAVQHPVMEKVPA